MTSNSTPFVEMSLSGWGAYPILRTKVIRPESLTALSRTVKEELNSTILARGKGRSYGDASINDCAYTILSERLNRLLSFDKETGVLTCESGVTLEDILHVFTPKGWFLPVTPGTKQVTIGGCLACDVHGKNHHVDGSFSSFVRSFKIILASGDEIECARDVNEDLFWATVGGMGLTGIVTEVTLRLVPIETAFVHRHSLKSSHLSETLELFNQHEPHYQYSVAWIDCLAKGRQLGRSILMLGNHARVEELPSIRQNVPFAVRNRRVLQVPFAMPSTLLNSASINLFNSLFYASHVSREAHQIISYDSFFYPLDALKDWNKLYGKRGFVQYQCVFPQEGGQVALTKMLLLSSKRQQGSFLAVLKRFGPQEGWLSFPMPGYTLTLDMPVKDGLREFVYELDQMVIE